MVKVKNWALQCRFAVLAFLPLPLDACANQYNLKLLYIMYPFFNDLKSC